MNWGLISALAEMLAAIGVIVTLIYLAMQIRKDAEATRANTTQLRATSARDTFLTVAASESLADLIARSSEDLNDGIKHIMESNGFDQTEAIRLHFFWMNIVRSTESNLRMPMSESEREQTLKQAASLLSGPARGWWEQMKYFHSDDFVKLIDERLRDTEANA